LKNGKKGMPGESERVGREKREIKKEEGKEERRKKGGRRS
jgi:hypothetical protein